MSLDILPIMQNLPQKIRYTSKEIMDEILVLLQEIKFTENEVEIDNQICSRSPFSPLDTEAYEVLFDSIQQKLENLMNEKII